MTLGKRIKLERKRKNISQQELGEFLNVSRQAVSRWENDISLPDINTLSLMADFFEVSLDSIAGNENITDEPNKPNMKHSKDEALKKATPYIVVLTWIVTMIALLPTKVKVPILFFGSIVIIFLMSCLLIYFIIKNYLDSVKYLV